MSIKYNAEGYYDPTAYTAILNVLKEDKRMSRAGEVWELESGRLVLVVADDGKVITVIHLYEDDRGGNDILISNVHGTRYGSTRRMGYAWASVDDVFVRKLTDVEYAEVKKCLAGVFGIKNTEQKTSEPDEVSQLRSAIEELKETVSDLEQANGSLSQTKTARFIGNYMKVLGL